MIQTRFGRNLSVFRSNSPLSDDKMLSVAPSIFATGKHESRSERYTYIPTIEVLNGLRREGFQPYSVQQSVTRILGKAAFTKHMVKLRKAGLQASAVGQEIPEISLVNSHDGTSAYEFVAGYLRLVCLNGLLVSGSVLESVKIAHKGDIVNSVIEGAFTVLNGYDRANESRDAMKATTLTPEEQTLFANAANVIRFPDAMEAHGRSPINAARLLDPRRSEDRANDLWTTFNRVQENAVQGGIHGRAASGRRMSTRAVVGISQNTALNRALWQLADGMRKLKEGAADSFAPLLEGQYAPRGETARYAN